jgi:hypothetical protein
VEFRFGPSARRFLDSQPQQVCSKLIDDVVWLRGNPHLTPDDPRKRPFLAPPVVIREYRDEFHWVLYYLENNELIIANIGDISEEPHIRRRPTG